MVEEKLRELAESLYGIGAVKFGDFATKSGGRTPVYFDLRVIVSYPQLMSNVSDILYEFAVKESACDHLCGVPYTALPLATLLAVRAGRPMLMRRKEAKAYGTKKMVEGHYKPGQTCLIIEDVVTSGSSVMETIEDLRKEGLVCSEAVVILDRQQGGVAALAARGVRVRALFTLTQLLDVLASAGRVDCAMRDSVARYLEKSQIVPKVDPVVTASDRTKMTFEERAAYAKNPVAKQLFQIMAAKESTLCISVDLTKSGDILRLLEQVGEHACLVKTHADIIEDFSEEFVAKLKELARRHSFLIMEDRKYADIGHTVALQYARGLHRVAEWADLVTAHSLPGVGLLRGLASAGDGRAPRGVFLLAEMSSEENLISAAYTEATLKLAAENPELVAGVVCQSAGGVRSPGLLQLTPGVRLDCAGDALGQTYSSPEAAVLQRGADVAVVGRGVVAAAAPAEEAARYRRALWNSYLERTRRPE